MRTCVSACLKGMRSHKGRLTWVIVRVLVYVCVRVCMLVCIVFGACIFMCVCACAIGWLKE
jgi:hypothetical protein